MDYTETLSFLYRQLPMYQRIGKFAFKKDLTNIRQLCTCMDNPQNTFPCIHIAGTNGKGSIAHMLAAVLQHAGYKTGLYTSPHLLDFRERIKVDGKLISEDSVIHFVNHIQEEIKQLKASFFELTVAMAFKHFSDEKVDVAVIETGLGGRLDSTNIITPILSIISNISFDHTQMLGNTLIEIAREKAGIIKYKVPVIIGETQKKVEQVFLEKARKESASISFADQRFKLKIIHQEIDTTSFKVNDLSGNKNYICTIHSRAPYQIKNLPPVFQAAELLRSMGYQTDRTVMLEALHDFRKISGFRGRWQILSHHPLLIADGAHNMAGLNISLKAFRAIESMKMHFILSVVQDKDLDAIVQLFPNDKSKYYFSAAKIPRALAASKLKKAFANSGIYGSVFPSISAALNAALHEAGEKDTIYAGGSMFTVAEVLEKYPTA